MKIRIGDIIEYKEPFWIALNYDESNDSVCKSIVYGIIKESKVNYYLLVQNGTSIIPLFFLKRKQKYWHIEKVNGQPI